MLNYRKIPKITPGAYIFQRPFLRDLCTEENLHLKIDWASPILGRKFTVFLCFTLYLRAVFQVQAPGGLILMEGFLHYEFGGLIHGGAYFRKFKVCICQIYFYLSLLLE